MAETSPDQQDVATVLGRVPSGLFILTVPGPANQETGMLASWVQQAGFEPPAVTVAVKQGRYVNDWLTPQSQVVLSLLGESQKAMLSHFGKGFEPGEEAFDDLPVLKTPDGVTALADTLGWLEGSIENSMSSGDHVIYLVRITAAGVGPRLESERPWVHLRKNGLGY